MGSIAFINGATEGRHALPGVWSYHRTHLSQQTRTGNSVEPSGPRMRAQGIGR